MLTSRALLGKLNKLGKKLVLRPASLMVISSSIIWMFTHAQTSRQVKFRGRVNFPSKTRSFTTVFLIHVLHRTKRRGGGVSNNFHETVRGPERVSYISLESSSALRI